jgi:uncharacterized phiE125 gp8 family phage protein
MQGMKSLKLITDATAEPVSLADLKTFIGLSTVTTVEDALVNGLEKAARKHAENYTGKAVLPETWQLEVDDFPSSHILLMRSPVLASSDVAITYRDSASGNSTTLTTAYYGVSTASEPPFVYLKSGYDWPSVYDAPGAVQITFKAGYETTGTPATDTCPDAIETWIKMRVKQMYEFREPMQRGQLSEMPQNYVDGLLLPYCLIDVTP